METGEGNLYGGFSKGGAQTVFCSAPFGEKQKGADSNGNRGRDLDGLCYLIERLDDNAENAQQRSARRRFYLKNGFTSSDIFIKGASGEMEVLNWGGKVSAQEYLSLQKHVLGNLLFSLSGIALAK